MVLIEAGMPLYAFMVEDGNGHGQVVHYGIMLLTVLKIAIT